MQFTDISFDFTFKTSRLSLEPVMKSVIALTDNLGQLAIYAG
jgi:hypothetical protein